MRGAQEEAATQGEAVCQHRPEGQVAMYKRSTFIFSSVVIVGCAFILLAASASATTPAPGWTLNAFTAPTNFSSGDNSQCLSTSKLCDAYQVTATDAGSEATDGGPVTITDMVPAGVTVRQTEFLSGQANAIKDNAKEDCVSEGVSQPPEPVRCTFPGTLSPDETLRRVIFFTVDDTNAAGTLTDSAIVSGG